MILFLIGCIAVLFFVVRAIISAVMGQWVACVFFLMIAAIIVNICPIPVSSKDKKNSLDA